MRYGFINNFSQLLAADLAQGATTMELDDGGALLANASADLIYTLTLDDGDGTVEIVHVTAATDNTLTIVRAQEGTADALWPVGSTVEMRVTAGVMGDVYAGFVRGDEDAVAAGVGALAGGDSATAVGTNAEARANNSTALGASTLASGTWSTAVGDTAIASGGQSAALGRGALSRGGWSLASGWRAKAYGTTSLAIGYEAVTGTDEGDGSVDGYRAVALGRGASATGDAHGVAIGYQASTTKIDAVAVGTNSVASHDRAIAFGYEAQAYYDDTTDVFYPFSYPTAIGSSAEALGSAVAIGHEAKAIGDGGIGERAASLAVGPGATARGHFSVSVGCNGFVSADNAVGIGTPWDVTGESSVLIGTACVIGDYDTDSGKGDFSLVAGTYSYIHGKYSTALGQYNYVTDTADYSVVIGPGAYSEVEAGVRINGVPFLPATPEGLGTDSQLGYAVQSTLYDNQPAIARRTSSQTVMATDPLDLTSGTAAVTLTLPAGVMLFIDAIDVVIIASATPDGAPEIRIGPDDVTPATYLAATPVTATAVGERETHAPLVADGVTSLRVETATAGTGTLTAKIVFRGYVMEL